LHEPSGFLDSPQDFAPEVAATGDLSEEQDITFTDVTLQTEFDDTSNNQFIGISPDGSNFQRFDNTEFASASFAEETNDAAMQLGLSRYDDGPQQATPRFGYLGQQVTFAELVAQTESIRRDDIGQAILRAFVDNDTADSEALREAGLFDADDQLLTRSRIPEFIKEPEQQVVSSERLRFNNP